MVVAEMCLTILRTTRVGPATTLTPKGEFLCALLIISMSPSEQTPGNPGKSLTIYRLNQQAEKVLDGPGTSYAIK